MESLILQSPLVSTKLWERDCKKLLKTLPRKNQKVIKTCLSIGATDSKVYAKAEAPFYKKYCYRGKPDPRRARYLKKFPNPHGGEVYLQMWGPSEYTCLGTLKKYDALPRLKRIKVPTKIICGQFDEARPNTLRDISKKIENSSFTIIPKASHAILAEQPAKMRKSVETFLRGLEK